MRTKRIGSALLALLLCITLGMSLSACKKKDTTSQIKAYIESAEDQMDSLRASYGDSMDIQLEARGNSLAYVYQYKIDTGMDNETMAEALESSLDAMSSTFTAVLSELKKEAPEAEAVIVEYQDKDGNVILSKEFK